MWLEKHHGVALVSVGLACSCAADALNSGEALAVPLLDPAPACPASLDLSPGNHDFPIAYLDRKRSYRIHVPQSHDRAKPLPLVLNMHGLTQDGPIQELASQLDVVSDANGFAVVYPSSDTGSWNAGACCNVIGPDDVPFMRQVVADVGTHLCVDRKRIYATGMSNGALMSHRLACDAADLFAAVAPVAGVLPIPEQDCRPSRPIPILNIHGSNDDLVGYEGDGVLAFIWNAPWVPIPAASITAAGWARRNGCASPATAATKASDWPSGPTSGGLIPGSGAPLFTDEQARMSAPRTPGASCTWYRECDEGAEVGLCVHDGGHDWATGSSTAMWKFFERHALP